MILLSRRSQLAIVAVVDVALNARPHPVAAKLIAARHNLPPRHLETILQALVHANILKGVRGPRGGYELARERVRITAGEIVRAVMHSEGEEITTPLPVSQLADDIVSPVVARAGAVFLDSLDRTSVEDLFTRASASMGRTSMNRSADFTI